VIQEIIAGVDYIVPIGSRVVDEECCAAQGKSFSTKRNESREEAQIHWP
jgi:hypothetical protein